MAINFEKALGIHEHAMQLRSKRTEVLANNLVNTDTPGFKARDIDFYKVLQNQMSTGGKPDRMMSTHDRHMDSVGSVQNPHMMYRTPLQPSLDGNTVDEQMEMTAFAKNAMEFQASLHFLNSKFKGLRNAIKGEV